MARLGPERVAAACNGIGPERWSQKARDTLDKWLWLLRPAADGHDCRFAYDNDGSDAKFRAANMVARGLEQVALIMTSTR